MGFDPRCHDLACDFLSDEAQDERRRRRIDLLAQTIQDAIEGWLEMHPALPEVEREEPPCF